MSRLNSVVSPCMPNPSSLSLRFIVNVCIEIIVKMKWSRLSLIGCKPLGQIT